MMPDAETLHLACDALVQRQRIQGRTEPSLLEQLAAADVSSTTGSGGNSGPRSRPPIDTGVVALLTEIGAVSRRQLADLGQTRGTAETPRLVRAATTATAATLDAAERAAWLDVLNRWHHAIRAALGLDKDRRAWLRGIGCPACHRVNAYGLDADRTPTRTPVLAVVWSRLEQASDHDAEAWRWEGIECRACGAWWDRAAVHGLVDAISQATTAISGYVERSQSWIDDVSWDTPG